MHYSSPSFKYGYEILNKFYHLLTCAKEEHTEEVEVLEKEGEWVLVSAFGPDTMGIAMNHRIV